MTELVDYQHQDRLQLGDVNMNVSPRIQCDSRLWIPVRIRRLSMRKGGSLE